MERWSFKPEIWAPISNKLSGRDSSRQNELQPELRLSSIASEKLVEATDGFSFAYLKELFLSSMMQWMSAGEAVSFAEVTREQATRLHDQMITKEKTVSASA